MTTQRTCHWLNDLLLFSWFVVPQQDYASIKHLHKIQYKTVKITACTCAYYSWPFNINAQYIDAIFMKPWSWKFVVSNCLILWNKLSVLLFFHEIHIATALRSAYNKTKERPSYSFNQIWVRKQNLDLAHDRIRCKRLLSLLQEETIGNIIHVNRPHSSLPQFIEIYMHITSISVVCIIHNVP